MEIECKLLLTLNTIEMTWRLYLNKTLNRAVKLNICSSLHAYATLLFNNILNMAPHSDHFVEQDLL